jgi:hypothetical protein
MQRKSIGLSVDKRPIKAHELLIVSLPGGKRQPVQRANVLLNCMMPRGLSPRLGRHECASDMQTNTRLPFVALVAPNNQHFSSRAFDRLHSMKKHYIPSMLCCLLRPETKQMQLAVQSKDVDTTLIDDAVRIVLQHMPDVAAVRPVSLVCRSATMMVSMRTHRDN